MEIAVGGDDSKVHIYSLNGVNLTLKEELTHLGAVTDVSYSPDNKYLVTCDSNRKVILYGLPDYKVSEKNFNYILFKNIFLWYSMSLSFGYKDGMFLFFNVFFCVWFVLFL